MSLSATRNGTDSEQASIWISSALEGADSRAMERYLKSIETKLENGALGEALQMSATLPQMCSTLEHPQLRTSSAHCVCWCDAWVAMDSDSQNIFPLTRVYLSEEGEDTSQWIAADAQFARSVSRSLLTAARMWYRRRGAYDLTVQYNLGRISRH